MVGVSVIIPFFRHKKWLRDALVSVYNQEYKSFEVIVINDGSDEDIDDVIFDFKNVRFYKIKNSGPGFARNFGIERAKGKFVAFLDSDDLWLPSKLSFQINFMESKGFVWSHSNYSRFLNDDISPVEHVKCNIEGSIIPGMFLYNPIGTPCIMIMNSVLQSNDKLRFSETIRIGEDSYFWFKLAEIYPLGYLNQYLTLVRMRGTNAAQQAYLQLKAKADSYSLVKASRHHFFNNVHYYLVLIGFYICKIFCGFVEKLSHKLKFTNSSKELLSKVFYSLPYTYLKVISYLLHR